MIEITDQIAIHRPAAEVFAFACDYRNDVRWRTGVVELRVEPDGPCQLGSRTRETLRFFGQTMITEGLVTDVDEGRAVAFRSTSGPLPVQGRREVVPDGEGATFSFRIAAEPKGMYRLLSGFMERRFRRQLREDLEKLKRAIETGVADTRPAA